MQPPRVPELRLPARPRPALGRVVLAGSILLHAVLFATLSISGRLPKLPPRTPPGVVIIELPPLSAPTAPAAPRRGSDALPGRDLPTSIVPAPVETPAQIPPPTAADSTPFPEGPVRIGPGYARGRLWVRPLPLPPRELARRLTRSHEDLVDSAVTAVIQAFLDSAASDSSNRPALPSWTTNIAGTKFGLDSKYLYIAGLKIPAAILALLPLPSGSNESRAFDRSGEMYQDLRRAAQRSATLDEFKDAIREIRERKEQEKEFEKNRRTPPTPPAETPDQ